MADSAEAICNLALLVIGQSKPITSLTADGTEEADVCNAVFEQDRDEVLSELAWPFATARVKPAPIVATTLSLGAVPSGWLYAFAIPADALRVRSIFTGLNPLPSNVPPFITEYDSTLD